MASRISHIKAHRERLGLGTTSLAHRLGVHQSSVVRLEQSEERGSISIESLRRAAVALGCTLEYRLVPKDPGQDRLPSTRKRRLAGRRTASKISEKLEEEQTLRARNLSPGDRILEACELSDFAQTASACTPKR